jgi:hypothetical protein
MEGFFALIAATLSFLIAMAVPLFAQRWRTLGIIVAVGAVFFGWLTVEMPVAGSIPSGIGAFLGGLMLFGFAGGVIARFVTFLGRRPETEQETQ